jgi:hypothetical protein
MGPPAYSQLVVVLSKYCSNTKKLLKEETKDFSSGKTYKVIEYVHLTRS